MTNIKVLLRHFRIWIEKNTYDNCKIDEIVMTNYASYEDSFAAI